METSPSLSHSVCLSLLLPVSRSVHCAVEDQQTGSSGAPEGGPLADAASHWPRALKPASRLMDQKHNHARTRSKTCVLRDRNWKGVISPTQRQVEAEHVAGFIEFLCGVTGFGSGPAVPAHQHQTVNDQH